MTAPNYRDLFSVFGRIGLLSFGGPAAQISLMHKELVEKRDWLSEKDYLAALSFCMLLPGPEAMQLATYAGWKQRGVWGGVLAGALFVIPGALVIFLLAFGYLIYGDLPLVKAAFAGIQAAVVVIVLLALRKIATRALTSPLAYCLAALSFVAIFCFQLPFPAVILFAACLGAATTPAPDTPIKQPSRPTIAWRPVVICLLLWSGLLAGLALLGNSYLLDLGLFFSKMAVVTFGGAYAVLTYMTQTVVQDFGWLSLQQMMDALGLAETTPGPLILVTQFVGILAGFGTGIGTGSWAMAALSGLVVLWVTFIPCYLWIFAGAPFVSYLTNQPRIAGAMSAITAAVTGVILNLSLWFALHVLFSSIQQTPFGPLPNLESLNPTAAALSAIALGLFLLIRVSMLPGLAIMAGLGLLSGLMGWA